VRIKHLELELKNKNSDIVVLKKKIVDSEGLNKLLNQKLAKEAETVGRLISEIDEISKDFPIKSNHKPTKNSNITEEKAISNIKVIQTLKTEKVKYKKLLNEYNSQFFQKNNMEKLFYECAEELKKEILKRKSNE
jgi:hypothetical protein